MCNSSGTKMSILQHLFSFGRAGASVLGIYVRRRGAKNKISAARFLAAMCEKRSSLYLITYCPAPVAAAARKKRTLV